MRQHTPYLAKPPAACLAREQSRIHLPDAPQMRPPTPNSTAPGGQSPGLDGGQGVASVASAEK